MTPRCNKQKVKTQGAIICVDSLLYTANRLAPPSPRHQALSCLGLGVAAARRLAVYALLQQQVVTGRGNARQADGSRMRLSYVH